MESSITKITASVRNAPLGSLIGALAGWSISKTLKYEKTLTVASFIVVGAIIGSAIGWNIKNK